MFKNGIPFILCPIPPTNQVKNIVCMPSMSLQMLLDIIKVEIPESKVQATEQNSSAPFQLETLIGDFLNDPTPQEIKISIDGTNDIFLQNLAHSPVNRYLSQVKDEDLPTFQWFNRCLGHKISRDQANLLAPLLAKFEKEFSRDILAGEELAIPEIKNLLRNCSSIMAEPTREFIQKMEIKKIELTESLEAIQTEIDQIDAQAERRVRLYAKLLILLSVAQMGFFYYTIFEVDWLGWDIMEPITYSAELVGLVFAMRFYYKNRKERSIAGLIEVSKNRYIKRSPAFRFRYTQLQNSLEDVKNELNYINKSISFYRERDNLM